MKLGVLGPLTLTSGDNSYLPTAPKQRQRLSLLLANIGYEVSLGQCMEELWDGAPPRTAPSAVQTYVLQIRRLLAQVPEIGSLPQAHRILQTSTRGYLLSTDIGELDTDEFDRRLRAAQAVSRQRDPAAAAELYARALDVWRGPALADVELGPRLQLYVTALEESHLLALEERIEAELTLGRHHELLSELYVNVMRYPTNESLRAQLMLALFRSGRQVQALHAYRELRQALHNELGVDPSLKIRRLHQAILASDSSLDVDVPPERRLSLDLVRDSTVPSTRRWRGPMSPAHAGLAFRAVR